MNKGLVADFIGNTPLIRLQTLSEKTGCEIYGKAEFLNPGGSIKDRAAMGIILDAEEKGLLKRGQTIVEGTAGNTGISLATISAQRGYKCIIVMPNNQAKEKYATLEALGAQVISVPPVPFANENHFYHTARRMAEEKNYFWANQFENTANWKYHYNTTGSEIWKQLDGKIDAFVSAVGTGGTLAGVSRYLKDQNPKIKVVLVDPFGSGLFAYHNTGKIEGTGSSITEGIGIMRLTANFKESKVDEAVQVTDQDMLSMLYYLAQNEGLIVGTSAALNVFAAYKFAEQNKGKNLKIVTMLCDSGLRYQSKVFNPEFLKEKGLVGEALNI